jgi:hypothetical protein
MIKTVIRCSNNMVIVFDKKGEQIPEYQGQYGKIKGKIVKDAPPSTIFGYFSDYETELKIVPKEEW